MRFSLQQMVQRTLAEAEEREKLAQSEETATEGSTAKKDEKGKPPAKTPAENTANTPERNEDTMMNAEGEKTSSAFVEKLASAVDYCNVYFFKGAAAPESSPLGPDKGPNTMPTNAESPTPGKQSENTGQATHNQPPMKPGADKKHLGQTNPATAMETDIDSPPGGSEDWSTGPDKMKQASGTKAIGRMKRFRQLLSGVHAKHLKKQISQSSTPGLGVPSRIADAQKKDLSKEVKKVWAARAGTAAGALGAGYGGYKGVQALRDKNKKKTASALDRVLGVMDKMAADAELPAKITGKNMDVPPPATQSEEGVPSLPGEASKQEALIMALDRAINYTKQQAKAVPKKRMGEVLTEPAQKKSTDPVLHENLSAASKAGVKLSSVEKVAAARALLQKIAEEGAAPEASPEQKERASKLQEVLKAKKDEKEKASQGDAGAEEGGTEGEEKTSGLPFQGGY